MAIELTYRAPRTGFLTVQPNVQHVFNPNADPTIRNALALGFRTEVGIKF